MSTTIRIIGVVIVLITILTMFATMYGSANEIMEDGLMVPVVPSIMKTIPVFIGEVIVLFIGLGIIALGVKLCSSSSR